MDNHSHAHPFELAGMGLGPFRFVGMVQIPSASLAEHNPSAYNGALASLPRNLIGGCGTCYNCGMAISNICIVENSTGQRYGIGSDCVLKTGDPFLGNKVKVTLARIQRAKRQEKAEAQREARRAAFLSAVCNEAGETNAQRIERENSEAKAAQVAREAAALSRFAFILPILDAHSRTDGDFCYNMAYGLRHGNMPRGRALDIVGDIYAKSFGRRDSKAYNAAREEFDAKMEAAQAAS
jgi:hypothetical protein